MLTETAVPIERRRFNRILITALGTITVALGGVGAVEILWPNRNPGKINAGKRQDLLDRIDRDGRPIYNVKGRFYLVRYDGNDEFYRYVAAGNLMAISQRCAHLGCRVPYCPTSGWFECPCHGARFNGLGEVMKGPAWAGMWRHPIEITSTDDVIVDSAQRIVQPPKGKDSGLPARGKFCVDD